MSQLAKEQRTLSSSQSSSTAALGYSGTLAVTIGAGSPVNITVDSGDSLTDIASKITSSGAKVAATVIFDGSGYRMQVRGLSTGASNAVSFGETGFDLGLNAATNSLRSLSQASDSSALGLAGTLTLSSGVSTSPITVSATDTLTDIMNNINGAGLPGVTASIVNDGVGYRLQVTGSSAVTAAESGFALGLTAGQVGTYQAAQDAKLTAEGVPITSSTNSVTGVIKGVTLALTNTTTSAATVTVGLDTAAVVTKVQSFVSAYNSVVKAGHDAAGFGSAAASNSELAGDSTIRNALDRIAQVVYTPVSGTSGLYNSLGAVGLKTDMSGVMSLDSAQLTAAIADDPLAVSKLFVTDSSIAATGCMKTFMDVVDGIAGTSNATVQSRIDGLTEESRDLVTQQANMQRRLDAYKAQLVQQFTAMEQAVSKYKTQMSSFSSNSSSGGILGGGGSSSTG